MGYVNAFKKCPDQPIKELPLKYKGKLYIGEFHGPNSPYFSFPFGAVGTNNIEPRRHLKVGDSFYDQEDLKNVEWLDENEEEPIFVYPIHTGSPHEGGGVAEIYRDPEKAIKFALMAVQKKNDKTYKIHVSESQYDRRSLEERKKYWEESFELKEKTYDFPTEHILKCWQSSVYEIIVYRQKLL